MGLVHVPLPHIDHRKLVYPSLLHAVCPQRKISSQCNTGLPLVYVWQSSECLEYIYHDLGETESFTFCHALSVPPSFGGRSCDDAPFLRGQFLGARFRPSLAGTHAPRFHCQRFLSFARGNFRNPNGAANNVGWTLLPLGTLRHVSPIVADQPPPKPMRYHIYEYHEST